MASDKRPQGVTPLKQSPFAALASKLPPAGERAEPAPERPAPEPPAPRGPARAVVRMERKGRGGKDVTIVEQLELSPKARAEWLKDLKQALGTGGTLEGESLILQGDHRPRVAKWLEGRGVKRISVSG